MEPAVFEVADQILNRPTFEDGVAAGRDYSSQGKAGEDAAASQAPRPLLQLLKNGAVSTVVPWLAAVRAFGVNDSRASE
jgi:hypothetical protein